MIGQTLTNSIQRKLKSSRLHTSNNPCAARLLDCWQNIANLGAGRFLAVDLETSSLEANDGEILSAGWVAIEHGQVLLASAGYCLVGNNETVGQSATIHHLRDCDLSQANAPDEMLSAFLEAAKGRVLLFHNANLDMAFLNKLALATCDSKLYLPFADTLVLEHKKFLARDAVIERDQLTLGACRRRYNLPYYAGHNALNDALATAELYLAQTAR